MDGATQSGVLHSFIVNASIILILALITHGHVGVIRPIEIVSSVLEPEKEFAEDKSVFLEMETVQAEAVQPKSDLDVVVGGGCCGENPENGARDVPELASPYGVVGAFGVREMASLQANEVADVELCDA